LYTYSISLKPMCQKCVPMYARRGQQTTSVHLGVHRLPGAVHVYENPGLETMCLTHISPSLLKSSTKKAHVHSKVTSTCAASPPSKHSPICIPKSLYYVKVALHQPSAHTHSRVPFTCTDISPSTGGPHHEVHGSVSYQALLKHPTGRCTSDP
jgi:hypothetical protein